MAGGGLTRRLRLGLGSFLNRGPGALLRQLFLMRPDVGLPRRGSLGALLHQLVLTLFGARQARGLGLCLGLRMLLSRCDLGAPLR